MTDLETKITISADDSGASAAFNRIEAHLKTMIASMEKFGRKTDEATQKQKTLASSATSLADKQILAYKRSAIAGARYRKEYSDFWNKSISQQDKDAQKYAIKDLSRKKGYAEKSLQNLQSEINERQKKEQEYSDFWNKSLNKKEESDRNILKGNQKEKDDLFRKSYNERVFLHKKESDAIKEKNRNLLQEQRIAQRSRSQSRQRNNEELGNATFMAGAVGAPTALGAVFALKQFAEDQNRRIGLKTEFGADAEKIYLGLKDYAIKTSFTMDEAVVLARRANMTTGLGINSAEKNLEAVRGIGSVLVASAVKSEDMNNATTQLAQMISSPRNVDIRQDVTPLTKMGLPIAQIITKFLQTGKDKKMTFEKKFEQGGVNNKLVFDALMWYSKTQDVIDANIAKQNALMNTWKSTLESLGFASAGVGKALDENLNITGKLKDAGEVLNWIDKSLQGNGAGVNFSKGIVSLGASMIIGTTSLMLFQGVLKRTLPILGVSSAAVGKLGFSYKGLAGSIAGISMLSGDWKGLVDDVSKDGFSGFTKHIDLITASVVALSLAFKSNLALMAIYGAYQGVKYVSGDEFKKAGGGADRVVDFFERSTSKVSEALGMGEIKYTPTDYDRIKKNQENISKIQTIQNNNTTTVENTPVVMYDAKNKAYNISVASKTKSHASHAMSNPIINPAL